MNPKQEFTLVSGKPPSKTKESQCQAKNTTKKNRGITTTYKILTINTNYLLAEILNKSI